MNMFLIVVLAITAYAFKDDGYKWIPAVLTMVVIAFVELMRHLGRD